MKIRPLFDRVVVERIDAERTTPSGLVIPDTADDKRATWSGRVIAVGPGTLDSLDTASDLVAPEGFKGRERFGAITELAMPVEVGNIVRVGKYSGYELDDKQVILRIDEILGVEESDTASDLVAPEGFTS